MNNIIREIITSCANDYEFDANKLNFINNPVLLDLFKKRANENEDEIKSLLYASLINYIMNPVASFEDNKLFFGSEMNALDSDTIMKLDINVIINVAGHDSVTISNPKIKNIIFEIKDEPNFILPLNDIVNIIINHINNGDRVLVHCIEGKSRSGSIIIAYFMMRYNWSYDTALKHVSSQRIAIPNEGFKKQLLQFNKKVE